VAPVHGRDGPLWSVLIPTYNADDYLAEALGSVLAQDPGPGTMHIEVVDDHSSRGDPEALVARLGGGRVAFFRQSRNLGHTGNFNSCLRRARGTLVHLLHADDLVRPGFYERLATAFRRPDVGAAFTRAVYADADGHWQSISPLERATAGVVADWLERIASGQRVATPAMVVRRAVYERLGGFDDRMTVGGEDWEMWVRIATRHAVWFEPEPLAVYRVNRPGSLTGDAEHTEALARDMLLATDIVAGYLPRSLPPARAAAALRSARALYASWAVEATDDLLTAGRRRDAASAAVLAVRSAPGRVAQPLIAVAARTGYRGVRRRLLRTGARA
jgi:hypothetical protein